MKPGYETELQRRRWYALAIMSIGSFMTPFDASIVAVALPAMGADLHLSYSQGLWAQAAYLLVASMLLIPIGRLADSRGPVRYYLLGTAIFAVGSIVAGLAPGGAADDRRALHPGRGWSVHVLDRVAGSSPRPFRLRTGAALWGSTSPRSTWVSPWVPSSVGSSSAMRVGGGSSSSTCPSPRPRSWPAGRCCGPSGAIGRASQPPRTPIDWAGAGLLGAALVALFIPLTFSPLWGWGSAGTIVPLVLTVVFLVAFVLVER